MKTIKYLSIFVLAILLFNCSKSDDDSDEFDLGDIETLILGSWKVESITMNGVAVELSCSNGLSTLVTFRDNSKVSFGLDYSDEYDCDNIPYSATYSIDGNSVIIDDDPWTDDSRIWAVIKNINDTTFQTTYTSAEDDVFIKTYQKN